MTDFRPPLATLPCPVLRQASPREECVVSIARYLVAEIRAAIPPAIAQRRRLRRAVLKLLMSIRQRRSFPLMLRREGTRCSGRLSIRAETGKRGRVSACTNHQYTRGHIAGKVGARKSGGQDEEMAVCVGTIVSPRRRLTISGHMQRPAIALPRNFLGSQVIRRPELQSMPRPRPRTIVGDMATE